MQEIAVATTAISKIVSFWLVVIPRPSQIERKRPRIRTMMPWMDFEFNIAA
jgi:hypothetical protein